MSARIEVQVPVRHTLRGYLWGAAILLALLAALAIWNLRPGTGTATKTETSIPITKSVDSPQSDVIAARYQALAKQTTAVTGNAATVQARYEALAKNVPAVQAGGSRTAAPGAATSPQQR